MLRSPQRTISIAAVALLALSTAAESIALERNDCSGFYTFAIRLMRVLYPQLSAKSVVVDTYASIPFDADGPPGNFEISVSDNSPSEPITAARD